MFNAQLYAVVSSLCLAGSAFGQAINFDFGNVTGAPDASYAAAGSPGVWNGLPGAGTVTSLVVDVHGAPTTASITTNNYVMSMDDPATSGDHETLFDDGLVGHGDIVSLVTISGLEPASYEVIVYTWMPNAPEETTAVIIDSDFALFGIAGGAWPGDVQEGVTHVVSRTDVTDTIEIQFFGGYFGATGFMNGVQIRPVLAPEDLDEDGEVGFSDLLILLAAWNEGQGCSGPCVGDLDGDLEVGFNDLLLLLTAWSGGVLN